MLQRTTAADDDDRSAYYFRSEKYVIYASSAAVCIIISKWDGIQFFPPTWNMTSPPSLWYFTGTDRSRIFSVVDVYICHTFIASVIGGTAFFHFHRPPFRSPSNPSVSRIQVDRPSAIVVTFNEFLTREFIIYIYNINIQTSRTAKIFFDTYTHTHTHTLDKYILNFERVVSWL